MDKRYQVFVSSTYADLKDERQAVLQALMEMDCIPAGMELFPAADEEQWQFIQRVIDDCDYYLLIIGGRYGSLTAEGVSYTEKEYNYAVEKGIKVVALIHNKPDEIPIGKSEADPTLREKLVTFREKVKTGRMVKFWEKASDLPGLVALSLSKTIKLYPAIGWVRANAIGSQELLAELNELRKHNEELTNAVNELQNSASVSIEGIASLDEVFTIRLTYLLNEQRTRFSVTLKWSDIFAQIAPYLLEHPLDSRVDELLMRSLRSTNNLAGTHHLIEDQDFQTIKVQLKTLNLVTVDYTRNTKGGMGLFWSLTPQGEKLMTQLRVVRSKPSSPSE